MAFDGEFHSRGDLRSGKRFAAKNQPYYTSLRELLAQHPRLTSAEPAVATRFLRIGDDRRGSLIRTTVRFRTDYPDIKHRLRQVFLDLFREHTENSSDGFEVVITFNAVLTNSARTTFSVFFGQDFGAENLTGAASQLKFAEPLRVSSLSDVANIPTEINLDQLISTHRLAFENSNVHIEKIINVVYLIKRFVEPVRVRSAAAAGEKKKKKKLRNGVQAQAANLVSGSVPERAYEGGKNFSV